MAESSGTKNSVGDWKNLFSIEQLVLTWYYSLEVYGLFQHETVGEVSCFKSEYRGEIIRGTDLVRVNAEKWCHVRCESGRVRRGSVGSVWQRWSELK